MISICFSGKNNSLVLLKSIRLRVLAELPHIQHTAFSQQIGQDALQDHDLFFNIYIVSQRDPRIAEQQGDLIIRRKVDLVRRHVILVQLLGDVQDIREHLRFFHRQRFVEDHMIERKARHLRNPRRLLRGGLHHDTVLVKIHTLFKIFHISRQRLFINLYLNGVGVQHGNIHFFHSYDCCARQYWRSRPLCSHENMIVIIGFGNYGRCILERAILTNIISVDQHVAYHIFGDAREFLAMHNHLHETFSLGEESQTTDSLIFHEEPWETHHGLLKRADRIIICTDDEPEGWSIFWRLNRYYKLNGSINLHSNRKAPGVSYFGTNEEIYTPDQIMRTTLNKAAVMINDIFRRSVSYPTLSWEDLDDFHRESKITAADHLLMKIRILLEDETITELTADMAEKAYRRYCETKADKAVEDMYRRIDHLRWLRFYTFYNWSYGPVRDDAARQHPMLSTYAGLTAEQKKERDAAWELLGSISVML